MQVSQGAKQPTRLDLSKMKKNGLWHVVLIAGGFKYNYAPLMAKLAEHNIEARYFWENEHSRKWTSVHPEVDFVIRLADCGAHQIDDTLARIAPDVLIVVGARKWAHGMSEAVLAHNLKPDSTYSKVILKLEGMTNGQRQETINKLMGTMSTLPWPKIEPKPQLSQPPMEEITTPSNAALTTETYVSFNKACTDLYAKHPDYNPLSIQGQFRKVIKGLGIYTEEIQSEKKHGKRLITGVPVSQIQVISDLVSKELTGTPRTKNIQPLEKEEQEPMQTQNGNGHAAVLMGTCNGCPARGLHPKSAACLDWQVQQTPIIPKPIITPPVKPAITQPTEEENKREFESLVKRLDTLCKAIGASVVIPMEGKPIVKRKKIVVTEEEYIIE